MKFIEHRRHTMRTKPGQDLSQEGVDLARRIGYELGPFEHVVTSTVPRAFQTAIAMGFAVDAQLAELSKLPDEFEQYVAWDAGYVAIAAAAKAHEGGVVARSAAGLAKLFDEIFSSLPEDGGALVISHGAIVEASAIGCCPDFDYTGWGACGYCEGVLISQDGMSMSVDALRAPGQ